MIFVVVFHSTRRVGTAPATKTEILRPQTPRKKLQKRQKPADFRRRHKNKTLKGTFEFLESIDKSEFRVVAEELEDFLDAQNPEANFTW